MTRLSALVLSLCFVSGVFGATGATQADAETLRVLALNSEQFFYEENGTFRGIEAQILDYFAKSRGATLDVEFVNGFAELLDRIEKHEADIAAGTITITDEREQRVDFSAPYFPVQVVLVERANDRSQSIKDLAGHKVAAFQQTTAVDALSAEPSIEIVTSLSGIEGMLGAVSRGEIRGAAADSSAIIPVLEQYPDLEITLTLGEEQDFGFAVPEGSALRDALSEHVLRMKESGIYFRIVTEEMGSRATEIVRAARGR